MKDSLGDRMKSFYEDRTRYYLPRKTYTIIRIDGKAFHSYTKNCVRPFDDNLMNAMDRTATYLCKNIQGARLAFVQSDEISILLTDFEEVNSQAWFEGNIQKMVSVSASMATSFFNRERDVEFLCSKPNLLEGELHPRKVAEFDSRVFTISSPIEVENYFIWRQQDTTRNSIQSVAQSLYSQKELQNKNCNELQEMIHLKGKNWNDYDPKYKRGRIILKKKYEKDGGIRTRWEMVEPPIFTQERDFLRNLIPNIPSFKNEDE